MLIERERWAGIQDGSVTVLFRRWQHRQVISGNVYRTGAGRIAVEQLDVLAADQIGEDDSRAAGYGSAAEAVDDLRGPPDAPIYRLRIRFLTTPDPRDELANTDQLDDEDVTGIAARLDRLDRSSSTGPWTMETLRIIEERPATRAADLASDLGRDPVQFKIDVRKLKNLGLTISLGTGYKLSPRGIAYLAAVRGVAVDRAR